MLSVKHSDVRCSELTEELIRGFIEVNIELLSNDSYYLVLFRDSTSWHYYIAENID